MSTADGVNPDADLHKPPIVEVALPNIEDGEENLLPVSATQAPLKVTFEMWINSDPAQGPETLTLFWNDGYLDKKTWFADIDPDDLFLMVPQTQLGEGIHVIHYEVKIYNGAELSSERLTITVDKTAPVLDQTDPRLRFPQEVVNDGVTAYYLDNHDDKVVAEVPDYDAIKPGDVLTWFWDQLPFSREEVDSRTLNRDDIGKPLTITFEGQMIRDRHDGDRYAYYQVTDRAGNKSFDALPVILRVAATPVPRDLSWPDVDKAMGTGELITLEPEKVALGATVMVPDAAVVYPDEVIWVQWAEPGQLGAHRTSMPTPADSRRYAIPRDLVAPHVGKQLPVKYEVVGPAGTFPSVIRQLQVQALDIRHLPMIQCEDRIGGDLSLASIPAAGARFKLETWTLMATTQRIRIKVTGVNASGVPIEHTVLDNHIITSAELSSGIGARGDVTASKAFMTQLKLNNKFSIKVYVSFDDGQGWPPLEVPNFPTNGGITLIA